MFNELVLTLESVSTAMSSLSFDDILIKKLSDSPLMAGPESTLSRVVDHFRLNDSHIWYKYPGLPFALNIEANLNGERHVIIQFTRFCQTLEQHSKHLPHIPWFSPLLLIS